MGQNAKYSFWIRACVSAAFFVVLFAVVGTREFAVMLREVRPGYFVLNLALVAVMIPASCLKWRILLALQGERVPFGFLLKNYLVGYYFSNLLPSNVGGDVVRSYYVGRHIGSQSRCAVSVFLERVSGILFLLLLGIVAPLMHRGLYARPEIWIPAVGAAGILLLTVSLSFLRRPPQFPRRVLNVMFARLRGRRVVDRVERAALGVLGHLEDFHARLRTAVAELLGSPRASAQVIALTVLFYFLTWVNVYLAFRAFGVQPGFLEMSAVVPTAMLVSMVPVSLGSLGLAEGAYVFYFGLVGIGTSASLVMALLLRFKLLLVGAIGFFFYLTYRHRGDRFDPSGRQE